MPEEQAELSMAERLVLAWKYRDEIWKDVYPALSIAAERYDLPLEFLFSTKHYDGNYTIEKAEEVIANRVYKTLGRSIL